ncbi:hypothetical protein RFI_29886 [Reticulomyxa filosa]|uniref:Uncharacterized protein n=1 Tax=Reticulomyxa filosa TaxID=46433 RepID=X6M0W3_RETFI|nr:hypothetical protein RFI_29886 [Reticulomyxa filosa]|eukprot:ETO07504.1 hypothetical protein RFI_29886 [Reticulomyxa filosa]
MKSFYVVLGTTSTNNYPKHTKLMTVINQSYFLLVEYVITKKKKDNQTKSRRQNLICQFYRGTKRKGLFAKKIEFVTMKKYFIFGQHVKYRAKKVKKKIKTQEQKKGGRQERRNAKQKGGVNRHFKKSFSMNIQNCEKI